MADRPYTSKQMGDACEMLVAAEMTLVGVPALKVQPHLNRGELIRCRGNGWQFVPMVRVIIRFRCDIYEAMRERGT